ncbi:MAG: M20/M25/M40 family metallo-hydrolase [Deltaproteobacteria bacterium]|nr:M20/M25/M40 family metallo-hydrolase [Deltaproteobacteria bacterium]
MKHSIVIALLLVTAACDEDAGPGLPDAEDVTAEADDPTMDAVDDVEPADPAADMVEEEPGPDPCSIEGLVAAISQENMYATLEVLSSFPERTSFTGQQNALEYLEDRLTGQGVEYQLHHYSWSGRTWANIEVILPGGDLENEIYIAGGHYDSLSEYGNAPGADDNGSGTAALVEMARVLGGCSFRRTVKLLFFSNEEAGIVGSTYYASEARGRGDDIRGFLALDSIGYGAGGEDIDAVTLPDDAWLVDRVEAVSATYVGAPILKRVLDACG